MKFNIYPANEVNQKYGMGAAGTGSHMTAQAQAQRFNAPGAIGYPPPPGYQAPGYSGAPAPPVAPANGYQPPPGYQAPGYSGAPAPPGAAVQQQGRGYAPAYGAQPGAAPYPGYPPAQAAPAATQYAGYGK